MAIYFTHFHQPFHSVSLPSSLFLPYMIWLYFSPFVSLLIFFLSFHFPLSSFFSLFPPLHVVIFPSSQLSSSAFIHPSSPSLYFTFPVLCSANAPLPPYRVGIDWVFTASLGFSHSPCWMQPWGSDPAGLLRTRCAQVTCQLFPYFTFSRLTLPYLLIPGCWKCASRVFPPHTSDSPHPGVYCHEDVSQVKWTWRLN